MALLTTYYTSSTPPFPKRKTNSNNFCMYDPWIEPRHAKKKERGPLFRANPSFATSKSATFATSKNVIKLKKLYFGSRKQTPLRAWTARSMRRSPAALTAQHASQPRSITCHPPSKRTQSTVSNTSCDITLYSRASRQKCCA